MRHTPCGGKGVSWTTRETQPPRVKASLHLKGIERGFYEPISSEEQSVPSNGRDSVLAEFVRWLSSAIIYHGRMSVNSYFCSSGVGYLLVSTSKKPTMDGGSASLWRVFVFLLPKCPAETTVRSDVLVLCR